MPSSRVVRIKHITPNKWINHVRSVDVKSPLKNICDKTRAEVAKHINRSWGKLKVQTKEPDSDTMLKFAQDAN